MNLSEAKNQAVRLLSENKAFYEKYKPIILGDKIIVTEFGWVFFYQSHDFIYKNNERAMLIGNCPIMIDKDLNLIFRAGTMEDIQYYITLYMEHRGDLEAYNNVMHT